MEHTHLIAGDFGVHADQGHAQVHQCAPEFERLNLGQQPPQGRQFDLARFDPVPVGCLQALFAVGVQDLEQLIAFQAQPPVRVQPRELVQFGPLQVAVGQHQ